MLWTIDFKGVRVETTFTINRERERQIANHLHCLATFTFFYCVKCVSHSKFLSHLIDGHKYTCCFNFEKGDCLKNVKSYFLLFADVFKCTCMSQGDKSMRKLK